MRLPKNRLVRFALYAISVVVILVAIDLVLIRVYARVHPGPDTTVLTTPTLPDNRVDYLAAIIEPYAAGVTRENNAAIPFIEAFGTKQIILQRYRKSISATLGLMPTPDDAHYVRFDEYYKSQHPGTDVKPPDIDPLAEQPWRAEDHPDAVAWLQRNAPYIDLLHQASLRPRYYYPYGDDPRPDALFGLLLPDMNFARETIDVFLTRAMLRAGTGDAAGAIDDLLTAHRFVALFEQSPISIAHQIAAHGDAAASRAARGLSTHLDGSQLRALADTLDRLPPIAPIAPVFDREVRFMYLDALQYISRQNPKQAIATLSSFVSPSAQSDDWELIARNCFPIDYNAHLRAVNGFFDRLVAALNEPTYPARWAAVGRVVESVDSLPYLLRTTAFLNRENVDRTMKAAGAPDLAAAQRTLTRIAVALARYKADAGHFPPSLADLASKYLPTVPADPYTLKPFSYQPTPTGYTLTCAGPNMADDSGKGDDLVVSVP